MIETLDDGELGLRAGKIRTAFSQGSGDALPAWAAELGEVVITDAAMMCEDVFDDACTVFLEACHPNGETHAVGVLIDNNLGGMAKDILLADSIDLVRQVVREHPPPHGDVKVERIEPGVAAGRIHAAIELTDMTWDPQVLGGLRRSPRAGPHARRRSTWSGCPGRTTRDPVCGA